MARQAAQESWLIFVDTNIYLDFYRQPGETFARQLNLIEKHKANLIISEQVWMEFLNNRQKVILSGSAQLLKPNNINAPSIVSNLQATKSMKNNIKDAIKNYNRVAKKIEVILRNPGVYDPVYKIVKKIFESNTHFNLKRPNKERYAIRRLARKRFALGYPPRKKNDTSIGDAINWEWIIRCAEQSNDHHHVLIVSRDGDYGTHNSTDSILNDWLKREFKARISQKRKIELTSKLTLALERLRETVHKADVEAEEEIIKTWE